MYVSYHQTVCCVYLLDLSYLGDSNKLTAYLYLMEDQNIPQHLPLELVV